MYTYINKLVYICIHICNLYEDRLYFFRAVLGSQKIQQKVQRVPMSSQPHTCTASPIISPHPMVHLFPSMNLHWHITITQSPYFTLGFTLGVVLSMDLYKCMTCTHHRSILQNRFTALKNPLFISPSFLALNNHWYFYSPRFCLFQNII